MFNNRKLAIVDENRRLKFDLDKAHQRLERERELHDLLKGCMDHAKLKRERDDAKDELKKVKRERDENWTKALEAQREAHRLERRLNMMNAQPMRYVVQSEGQEVSVIAVVHDFELNGELILLDREEIAVASFKTYSSYRIEPIPAE